MPASLVELPPIPKRIQSASFALACNRRSPTPIVDVRQGFRCSGCRSLNPQTEAISKTANFPEAGRSSKVRTEELNLSMETMPISTIFSLPIESLAGTFIISPSYLGVKISTKPSPPSVKGQEMTSNLEETSDATSLTKAHAS